MSIYIDLAGVDWKMLAKQKRVLVDHVAGLNKFSAAVVQAAKWPLPSWIDSDLERGDEQINECRDTIDALNGVINLIDHIQDEAALQIGVNEVFPNEDLE